ncbi:MAG: Uma2 family endonuclease [Lachnospiraceae bacterium]|nr:Uma2 family endonuclease [Candidatus Equihabitans merdae]
MFLDEMIKLKREVCYTNERIAELSGVPVRTVQKIFSGETKHPRYDTLQALQKVFASREEKAIQVRDNTAPYLTKQPGDYTVEDYRALPDDLRVELIDGRYYYMEAPTTFHQYIAGSAYAQLVNQIASKGGRCIPFISPIDVRLEMNNKTMVQPDVIIVCDPKKVTGRNIEGAPDFVMEVISPSSKSKDYYLKRYKYEVAGTREYWIVDPYAKYVITYHLEKTDQATIHPLSSTISLGIYDGEIAIDFSGAAAMAEQLMNQTLEQSDESPEDELPII